MSFPLQSHTSLKMLNFCKLLIFIFLVSAVSLSSSSNAGSECSQADCLKVPASSFISSLKTTVDAIQQVVPVISKFANLFDDFRLTNAISDCLDLLDFSADELSWSISASQNPNGRHNGSGDLSSDLRTWLSAALINQETCIDGFDGTNSIVKGVVSGSLNQISSSVQELLTMVHPSPSQWSNEGSSSNSGGKGRGGGGKSSGQFPHWFKREDRKLLLVNGVQADVVVAADGTGNFTKIRDVVLAAEDYSMKRFVIYIKRGVYKDLFAGLVWNVAGYVAGIRVLLEDSGLLGMGWSVVECLHWSVGVWLLEYSHWKRALLLEVKLVVLLLEYFH